MFKCGLHCDGLRVEGNSLWIDKGGEQIWEKNKTRGEITKTNKELKYNPSKTNASTIHTNIRKLDT